MNTYNFLAAVAAMTLIPQAATSDVIAVVIDASSLPFELSANNFANSPDNYANSSDNYANSDDNYANSSTNYSNSPSNYANGTNGDSRIISEDNLVLGYYVFSENGLLNIFSVNGKRIAYMPNSGQTQSIFLSSGGWCGTFGDRNGAVALGLSQRCLLKLKLN